MTLTMQAGLLNQHLSQNAQTLAAFPHPLPTWAIDKIDSHRRIHNYATRSEALLAILADGNDARTSLQSRGINPLAGQRKEIRDCQRLQLQLPQNIVDACQNADRRNPGHALARMVENAINAQKHFAASLGQTTEPTEETPDRVATARESIANAWRN